MTATDLEDAPPVVLVVDDEPSVVRLIALELKASGYAVKSALVGGDAYRAIEAFRPAVVVLEVMLPGAKGFDVLVEIKRRFDVPVVFLTSQDNDADRAYALEIGADDYIRKPFVPHELSERLQLAMHRPAGPRELRRVKRSGDLEVDLSRSMARRHDVVLSLTTNEWAILFVLASEANQCVASKTVLTEVFGEDYASDTTFLEAWMRRLRKKIELDPDSPEVIVGDARSGYTFRAEDA
jgi:two-component system KDP operon response regulator KdpE